MKLMKYMIIMATLVVGCVGGAMANEVVLTNISADPIPIKYQVAYKNPKQSVILKAETETLLPSHGNVTVDVSVEGYQYAGVVVRAIKPGLAAQKWVDLPSYARQFNGQPGCWMATDKQHASGHIVLSLDRLTDHGKHGLVTCRQGV